MFKFISSLFRRSNATNGCIPPETVSVRVCKPERGGGYLELPKEFIDQLGTNRYLHAEVIKDETGDAVCLEFTFGDYPSVERCYIKDTRRVHSSWIVRRITEFAGITAYPTTIDFIRKGDTLYYFKTN